MSKDLQQTDGCVTVGTGVAVRRTAVVVRRTVVPLETSTENDERTSLVVQWLTCHTASAESLGFQN